MFVAVASRPAIASTVVVAAIRFIVTLVTSVASRSTIGITAPIVVASIVATSVIRLAPVVLPALALACLATCVICVARLAFLANVVCDCPLGAVTKLIDLGAFEHTVVFALCK